MGIFYETIGWRIKGRHCPLSLIHHNMLSMINLPDIMNEKPTIWTIHDPWLLRTLHISITV